MEDVDNLPATYEGIGSELAAIESEMGTRAYIRDEGKQERYRALLRRRESIGAGAPTILDENPLQYATRAELEAVAPGADYSAYTAIMREVADVFLTIPSGERGGFVAAFEALPDGLVGAMVEELTSRTPTGALPVSEAVVAEIGRLPQCREVVREWGQNAARNIAVVQERLWRLLDGLDDSATETFFGWLENLSPGGAGAVYRKLAA